MTASRSLAVDVIHETIYLKIATKRYVLTAIALAITREYALMKSDVAFVRQRDIWPSTASTHGTGAPLLLRYLLRHQPPEPLL